MNGKTALVTGASSGIGRKICYLFAKDGIHLVVCARRLELLEELKKDIRENYPVEVEIIQADLSCQDSSAEIHAKLKEKSIHIDYLVNNAGFGGYGKFHERDWIKDKAMINVNILALTELTRLLMGDMIRRNFGHILNIASTAAFLPGPFQAVYYASKTYVLSFSQAIAEELSDTKIKVTAFCPTATETGFDKAGDLGETPLFSNKRKNADQVALSAYKAMNNGRLVVIDSAFESFGFRWIFPFLTRKRILKISRSYMEKK